MKQRKDGRWVEAVTVSPGKRKYLYAQSKQELKAKVRALEKEIEEGIDFASDPSFSSWAKRFLKHYEPLATESQYKIVKSRLQPFIDSLGNMSVKNIKPFQIEAQIAEIAKSNPYTGKPSSQKTLTEYNSCCSRVFEYAIENRIATFNPCKHVSYQSQIETKKRRALTSEEIKAIENMTGRARLPALIAIYTGLREGELTALTWNDIDLGNRRITVNKSYSAKSHSVKLPKTKAGIRLVPINDKLHQVLSETPLKDRSGLVINEYGHYTSHGLWRSYVTELLLAVDKALYPEDKNKKSHKVYGMNEVKITIEPFDFHCLRHTFATLLYAKGVDVKTAQKWLGHKSLSTTMNIYTHLAAEKELESSEKWI